MNMEFDTVVVGGGCIGASIFFHLAQLGLKNLALVDHGRRVDSATSQSGGLLRVLHESADHVELAIGHARWNRKLEDAGVLQKSGKPTGAIYFFHKDRLPAYEASFNKMSQLQISFEILDESQGKERFPSFLWKPDECGVFEPDASQRSPTEFSNDLLQSCTKKDLPVFEDFEVRRICAYSDRYRLTSPRGTVTARSLVLAGGARLLPRLRDLGLAFPLVSEKLAVVSAPRNNENTNRVSYFDRETLDFGGFGRMDRVILSNPSQTRMIERSWRETFEKHEALDAYSPQRRGILGQVPGHPRLILATGWGGTAFKFALEAGHRVAKIVERDFYEGKRIYA